MEFKIIETESALKTTLGSIKRSAGTIRGNVQGVLEFAGAHFDKCGDTCHFVTVFEALPKTINRGSVFGYSRERWGVTITSNDQGEFTVKKDKSEGAERNNSLVTVMWDEWNKPKVEKEDFSLEQLKKYLKRKAEADKGVSGDAMAAAALALKTIVDSQAAVTES